MIYQARTELTLYGLLDFIDKYIKPTDVIYEIGTWTGESAVFFARKCKHIYTIDNGMNNISPNINNNINENINTNEKNINTNKFFYDKRVKEFNSLYNTDKITLIENTSENIANIIPDNSIDLVYIDADHSYDGIKNDIKLWLPKIKNNGYISGHDYHNYNTYFGVIKAVDEIFGRPDEIFVDSSWVVQIKK
jgi:cephalosporin hydroxylase